MDICLKPLMSANCILDNAFPGSTEDLVVKLSSAVALERRSHIVSATLRDVNPETSISTSTK